jgi:Ca2+-binding EF-hand superfamily protein
MKRIITLAAAVVCAGGLVAAAPDAKPADKAAAPDYQDFVFFGDARPVLIRVHAEIDGRPLEAAWNDFMDRLFAHLDADGDGVLSKDELERAPTPQALFNSNGGRFAFAPPGFRGQGNPYQSEGDGPQWDKKRFAAAFRRAGGAPFQSQDGAAAPVMYGNGGQVVIYGGPQAAGPSADALTDALFDLLDTDKDGKLSRQELAAAPEVLMKLDADEDETVSVAELLRTPAQPTNQFVVRVPGSMPAAPPAPGPFLMVGQPGGDPAALPRQLQARYGPKDEKGEGKTLTREDLGLDKRAFARLDADGNGKLDYEELSHFADRPADLELKLRLGRRPHDVPAVEVLRGEEDPLPPGVKEFEAGVRLDVGNARLVLRGVEDAPPPAPDALRQQYLAQFKAADRGGKGYLTENEAMASPFFRNVFKAMDRDGDGKLFEKEVTAYLDAMQDLQSAAASSVVTAGFADDGRGLFDLIDLNHDGRLSLREMRQMVKLIDQLDKDGDGKIARSEILKSYQVTFRQGPAGGGFGGFRGPVVVARPFGVPQPAPPEPTAGPLWFRKMDRNHDGDVSRKEFLGTDEEFKRLDLDGDGLISLEEAMKADAALRKPRE